MEEILNYIDGAMVPLELGKTIDVYNPSNGQVYAHIPDSDTSDIEKAVQAAKNAFPKWAATSITERHDILSKIADLIDQNLDLLAEAESRDNGKPLWLSKKVDIPRGSDNMRFFANAITQFSSESHEMQGAINYTLREPLGVIGTISPWNLPLYLFTWKIAPALAAGNTVVAKPSEVTPLTAFLFSKICIEAGLPPGVLNVVHGLGHTAGAAIVEHKDVKAISFTGSTRVGKEIATIAAPEFKKLSLEMGGKNPNVIFADCDYDKMLKTTINSSFSNQGQICLCGSRILVERSIYDRFKTDFITLTKEMKVGDPFAEGTRTGAMVSKVHMEKVLSCIKLAKDEGGKILAGGERVFPEGKEKGYYIAPTIIEGLPSDCRTNQEEIFGPVVTMMPFDSENEAIDLANDSSYGLSCTLWTNDVSRSHRVSKKIHAGIVWVNTWLHRDLRTPFGGVKNSGIGREGGFEALRFFTEPKNVCIKY